MPLDAEAPTRPAADAVRVLTDLLAGLDNSNGSGEGKGTTRADVLAGLTELRTLLQEVARWEPLLISAARDRGASWAEIAPALGLASRQAAERRFLRLEHQTGHAGLTGDQRVQATRDRRAGDRAVAGWARGNSAALRGLAGQITALEGLDPATQACVDRVRAALGENDTAALIEPLAEVAPRLATTHSALADQLAAVAAGTASARRQTSSSQTSSAKKEDAP
ncbi:hypothetical protein OG394_21955 [Kribbella sp. NBC_01245]|uniref:hypothetical protein n=1 Tax=Kribbella sp. NBC_01245 TaxID=2903578 RepID=UPI002E2B974F|nr:hypothetical protein [Kribbella sp. NBC_01245]